MKDVWHLQDLDWLSELQFEEREMLRERSFQRTYAAGEIIFMPVPNPDSVYLLEEGLVRIYRLSETGLETSLGFVRAGEIFGELAVFGDYPRESFAQAVEASRVWKIPRRTFRPFVESRPGLAFEVSKQIGGRLKQIESRVESLVFRDVKSRLVLMLLELAKKFGVERDDGSILLEIPLTQAELATLVGSTRQSVNASLAELAKQGLVGRERQRNVLLKPVELRQEVH
jgi:CRP/FNR family cyclic AMP-dependent transcriptional regulator